MEKPSGGGIMFKHIVVLLGLSACFIFADATFADVKFNGKVKTNDGHEYEGRIFAPTPSGTDHLKFEYNGNPVNVQLKKIKNIKRKSKGHYIVEILNGSVFAVSPEKKNIYSTFSGSLTVSMELGQIFIRPERIVEITFYRVSQ
jgi:hypothetical protein